MFCVVSVLRNGATSLRDSVRDVPIFVRTIDRYTLNVLEVPLEGHMHQVHQVSERRGGASSVLLDLCTSK